MPVMPITICGPFPRPEVLAQKAPHEHDTPDSRRCWDQSFSVDLADSTLLLLSSNDTLPEINK